MDPIRFQAPELPSLTAVGAYWSASESSQWYSNGGPCLRTLSQRLVDYVGQDVQVIPVSSATTGLLIALRALADPRRGRYVVTPSYTFAATAAVIRWAGFEPLFVDIDPSQWHAAPEGVERALSEHRGDVAALLLCSTYGAAPSDEVSTSWSRLAAEGDLPLVVDTAAGFGSLDEQGRRLGGQGDAEIFSFHATKPFAIGEGGAIFSRSAAAADEMRRLVNFGFDENRMVSGTIGLNGKMDELHAATALAVLDGFEDILASRRKSAAELRGVLDAHGYVFQAGAETSTFQFLPMLCESSEHRQALMQRAADRSIELRSYFGDPLHRMTGFSPDGGDALALPVTDDVASRIICLPIYNSMAADVIDRLVELCCHREADR